MTIDEYEELIPPAHRYPRENEEGNREDKEERSRFAALVRVCVQQGVDIANMLDAYLVNFDLDYAVGEQLDILGTIVGANRKLPFLIDGYEGVLGDEDMRLLIKARIAQNIWDGTNKGLVDILQSIFGDYGITFIDSACIPGDENKVNMHMTYVIRGTLTDLQINMFRGDLIVPRPAGVDVTYQFIGTTPATNIVTTAILGAENGTDELEQILNVPAPQS